MSCNFSSESGREKKGNKGRMSNYMDWIDSVAILFTKKDLTNLNHSTSGLSHSAHIQSPLAMCI